MDEKSLSALLMRDSDFAELERTLSVFCPFEAVGMVRQEIRHAHFLAYILDPNRPHGFGDTCLRAFLTAAVEAQGDGTAVGIGSLDIHLMDLQGATVRREWNRIDLLIEVPASKFVLAVELKVSASEAPGQLAKYETVLSREHDGWHRVFVFLTTAGVEASEEQAGTWAALPMETVERVLRLVSSRHSGGCPARSMLLAYLDMLRRHHLNNERLEQLAADLWKRHREALEFLADRQPNVLSDAMRLLIDQRDEIANALGKIAGLSIVCDSFSGVSELRFAVADWDEVPGMKGKADWTETNRFILLIVARNSDNIKVVIILGPGDNVERESIYQKLKESSATITQPDRLSPQWKRLASETVVKLKSDDDLDPEKLVKKARECLEKMAKGRLIEFDKALRPQSRA